MDVYFDNLRINEKIGYKSDKNLVETGGNCNLYVS